MSICMSKPVSKHMSTHRHEFKTALRQMGKSEAEVSKVLARIPSKALDFNDFLQHAHIAAEVTASEWKSCAILVADASTKNILIA